MKQALNGINLGGWLVLEKWIMLSLFKGIQAKDEYSFCKQLGYEKANDALSRHRDSFITEADFKWLKNNNVKYIRIPVGYWIFGDEKPFISAIKYLDFAFKQAEKFDLKILIDMHGAAGSQNGEHHSGKAGEINWHKLQNRKKTVSIISRLVARYKDSSSLWGIEILNEPDRNIDKKILLEFYRECCSEIRKTAGDEVKIVISDQFLSFRWMFGLGRGYKNIMLDRHLYQIFSSLDKKTSYKTKIFIVRTWWRLLIFVTQLFTPMIVGEWSAALPRNGEKRNRQYMEAQKVVFSKAATNFFWTYKTQDNGTWDYKATKDY